MNVTQKIYKDRLLKTSANSRGRKKSQAEKNRTVRNCATCAVIVLNNKKLPTQCHKEDCWL